MYHKSFNFLIAMICILVISLNSVWSQQDAPSILDIKIDSIIGEQVSDVTLLISIINNSDKEINILPPIYYQNDFYTQFPDYWWIEFGEPQCEQMMFMDAQGVCPKVSEFVAIPPSDSYPVKIDLSKSLGLLRCEEDLDFKFKVIYNPTLKRNLNFCEEEIRNKIGELDQIILTSQEVVLPFKKRR